MTASVTSATGRDASAQRQRISVALCTYNGTRFLPHQLDSILRQTRLPDELVAIDDCSSDDTVSLLERFAARAPFPVRIERNPANCGSTRNFERAVLACSGDLIALSDQDDVWKADRLERSEQELQAHPEAGLVFSDADVIDDEGSPVGVRLWDNFAFHQQWRERIRQGDFIPMARRCCVTGATVMFRAAYRDACFPVGPGWVHDGWMASIIACLSGLRMIEAPLIEYRMHASQQIGLGPKKPVDSGRRSVDLQARCHWSSFATALEGLNVLCAAIDRLPLTEEQRARGPARGFYTERNFLAMRLGLPQARLPRIPTILREAAHYRACAKGWLSMAKDVWLPKDDSMYTPPWPSDPAPESNREPDHSWHSYDQNTIEKRMTERHT